MKSNNTLKMTTREWLKKNYLVIVSFFLGLYLLGAFFAPILLKLGFESIAIVFYRIYGHCHQLAYRSWFLFGQQSFYPRELANIDNLLTFEEASGINPLNLQKAREFFGNENIGYKVALCQRDIAIYVSLLLSAILYMIFNRKLKPLPLYLWIAIGLIPLAIDGISQFGGLSISFLNWLPARESTPFLRTITGCLFGFSTGFCLFPLIDVSFSNNNKNNGNYVN